MSSINVLIVEGNNPKDSEVFIKAAKASCAENMKNIVLKLEPLSNVTIINPANDNETKKAINTKLLIIRIVCYFTRKHTKKFTFS